MVLEEFAHTYLESTLKHQVAEEILLPAVPSPLAEKCTLCNPVCC